MFSRITIRLDPSFVAHHRLQMQLKGHLQPRPVRQIIESTAAIPHRSHDFRRRVNLADVLAALVPDIDRAVVVGSDESRLIELILREDSVSEAGLAANTGECVHVRQLDRDASNTVVAGVGDVGDPSVKQRIVLEIVDNLRRKGNQLDPQKVDTAIIQRSVVADDFDIFLAQIGRVLHIVESWLSELVVYQRAAQGVVFGRYPLHASVQQYFRLIFLCLTIQR